jgi:protein-S-isoprenylcysteine O-methyltransferase Ste14
MGSEIGKSGCTAVTIVLQKTGFFVVLFVLFRSFFTISKATLAFCTLRIAEILGLCLSKVGLWSDAVCFAQFSVSVWSGAIDQRSQGIVVGF